MKHTIVKKIWIEDGLRKELIEEKKTDDGGEILYFESRQTEESVQSEEVEEAVEEEEIDKEEDYSYMFDCEDADEETEVRRESLPHALLRIFLEIIGLVPAE